ncbi:Tyrosine permease [Piscirickettsia salmonis]|uniref:Aromatic amino acid permease n=1 Tax=Piscirickettsia salmonis TaxID=1238 RepID=A0A1L6TFV8_PISSA|nr:aromatic amino acid transporter [Piscirickettsia salmonis]AKP74789.1 aromatic amino acid transport family protein [Piscirickettsia salmonis LF-89 = ATCC VR-1361]ALB21279.1 Tryptophan/tryrosine permease [Piscirickettsia salmonis]ALY01527.1 aromatic amino acid transport family protein [Piscirickettsia salmonis]AMA41040.1 aromatic amino acid transport family protein [Piscirickettsia salmonis]AOS36229.1 aromatic amino acid transport family protein [Piscirickettsia salmonis]
MKNTLGSILIIAGTAIGGGMLALPLASAGPGFSASITLLAMIWLGLLASAFVLLEAVLAFPKGTNFSTIARLTLGLPGQIAMWISMLMLLYALDAAYISGGSSLIVAALSQAFNLPISAHLSACLFLLILGSIVWYSTRAVDRVNSILFSLKGVAFILLLSLFAPHVNLTQLLDSGNSHYLLYAIPIFFTSFGFHPVIPTIASYNDLDPKRCRRIILIGGSLPIIIYLVWEISTLGIIPRTGDNSFHSILNQQGSVGEMMIAFHHILNNKLITLTANAFSDIAVTTSFLGVSLALFDFIADATKRPNTIKGRSQTAFMAFLPPLAFALFYPNGFILALSNAAIVFAITLAVPVLSAWRLRITGKTGAYKVAGGYILFTSLLIYYLVICIIQICSDCGMLAQFGH